MTAAVAKTAPDWLTFRTQAQPLEALEAMRGLFGGLGPHIGLKPLERGMDGFRSAAEIRLLGETFWGRMDFGGESQRGWVRVKLTGAGCENVRDWDALADIEALPAAEIRRLDIALTTWKREVLHEHVVEAHAAGLFRGSSGGRPPALRQIISSDALAGRSCFVGDRKGEKYLRAYEKGFELRGRMGRAGEGCTHIDGFPIEDIYRCEVELKPKTTVVPWEAVERRDQYFAGSYPFLGKLLPGVEADILMRRPERAAQTSLKVALANARIQFGPTLFTALTAYHGDIGRVWDQIVGKTHNADLLAAGVLQVDHDEVA